MSAVDKLNRLEQTAQELEGKDALDVISWAGGQYQKLALACSFGAEDIVLVDLVRKYAPHAEIFYLDTDLHFKETYEVRDRLEQEYNIKFVRVSTDLTLENQAEQHGDRLWEREPDQCCAIRKIIPLQDILTNYDAWITGIRRDQAPTRANTKKAEYDIKFGLDKFNPIADWASEQVWDYIKNHELDYNKLHDKNYPSVGCEPCTRSVAPGEDPRAGRWAQFGKTECGLHPGK